MWIIGGGSLVGCSRITCSFKVSMKVKVECYLCLNIYRFPLNLQVRMDLLKILIAVYCSQLRQC